MRARARDGGINMTKALRDGRFFYALKKYLEGVRKKLGCLYLVERPSEPDFYGREIGANVTK